MAQAAIIDKCDLCESNDHIDYFCINCEEILCLNCKLSHSKSRKTRNDNIISLSQARHDDLVHKSTTVYCREHSTIEITLFCLKCDQPTCTRCLIKEHNGHNIADLNEIRDSKTEELNRLIKSLKGKKTLYENLFDIQGQAYCQFLKSIDKVEKEILLQKAKILEELDIVCKEQFSELRNLRQKEEKTYTDVCNKVQEQNQAITSAIQTAQNSIDSNNTALIVQATVDAINTLHGLVDLSIPLATIATYQPGNRSHPAICHVQGMVKIEQKSTTYQHCDSSHNNVPLFLGKVKTEQLETKSNQMTDVFKVELLEKKTNGGNKQQRKPDAYKPTINVDKVRVLSTVEVKGKNSVVCIIPLENKTAWIKCAGDNYLTLINSAGKIITTSVSLDNEISDITQYRNGLLVTCWTQCKITMISVDGKSASTFSDLSPYYTRGLCVTQDMDVMVCLYKPFSDNKVVRLNTEGTITQTIQHDVTGAPLYNDPYRVTTLTTGEVIVRDFNRIVGVNKEGGHLFTWEGEMQGRKLDDFNVVCITHDSNNNLFLTDDLNSRVFVLGKDGSGAMCLLDSTHGILGPFGISVDNTGQLWVGCVRGNIHIIEY